MSPILGPGANSGATPLIGNPGGGGAGGAAATTPATPAAGGKQPGGNGAAAKLQQVPPGTVIGGTRPQWSHEQQNTHAGLSPTSGATSPMRDSGIAGVNPHFRLGGHPPPDSALLSSSLGGSAIVDDTSSAASGASGAGLVCMYPRFQIGPRIGSGSFGCVYKGWHLKRNVPGVQLDESLGPVAIKVEPVTDDKGQPRTPVNGLLPAETAVLVAMSGKTGFPTVFWYGEFGVPQPVTETASGGSGSLMSGISEENPQAPPPLRMYRALVMDVLGPSLQDLFDKCGKKLSVKTVCMIADQMLCRLQELHYAGFLHRDLKPENVLMGLGPRKHILYLIDFGLACQRPLPSDPTPKRAEKCIGTLRYMCRSSHRGKPQTPRDDLEALGFLLVFFAKGSLPWQRKNLPAGAGKQHVPQDPNEQKRAVLKSKDEQVPHVLCAGLPPAFAEYMAQVRGMGFLDFPDYNKLRGLFSECVKSMGANSPMLFAGPAPGAALHQPPQYYAHQHHVPQALPIGYTHYQHQQQSHNLYDVRHAAAGADGGWQGAGAFFNGGVLVSDPMAAGAPPYPVLGMRRQPQPPQGSSINSR
ncbi:kinase-like domain-containing protein [Catenaria anguillulae PL171]|uniref:non-specific serine/threonine protein kinase n=1 Tax=Catenaria anguillulae PL171 TaxID=765915 RepID=A0A1Y2H7S4_9FUNG|nr:kinase-like domain-containing protein [Catenaria anguillulae PL171]